IHNATTPQGDRALDKVGLHKGLKMRAPFAFILVLALAVNLYGPPLVESAAWGGGGCNNCRRGGLVKKGLALAGGLLLGAHLAKKHSGNSCLTCGGFGGGSGYGGGGYGGGGYGGGGYIGGGFVIGGGGGGGGGCGYGGCGGGGGGCGGCGGGCGWCGGRHYGRKRRSLDQVFENEIMEDLYYKISLEDQSQCGLRLVCDLAQKDARKLTEDEALILLPYRGVSANNINTYFGAYDFAARSGQEGLQCSDLYPLCKKTTQDIMYGDTDLNEEKI
ncbi:unnamed protein product, partial [Meganyctiphanes norvegica]